MKVTTPQVIGGFLCLAGIASASPFRYERGIEAQPVSNRPFAGHKLLNHQGRTQQMLRSIRYNNIRSKYDSNWHLKHAQCPTQRQSGSDGQDSPPALKYGSGDDSETPTATDDSSYPTDSDSPDSYPTYVIPTSGYSNHTTPVTPTVTDIIPTAIQTPTGPVATPYFFDVPLDHSDKSKGTFKNRYFVNDTFYSPGGPIFLYDAGEGGITGQDIFAPDDLNMKHAIALNGLVIQWEHRYYGKSTPPCDFNISESSAGGSLNPTVDANTVGEYYKYLTIDNALDDLALFAKSFTWNVRGNETMHLGADKVPWIMVGGSYPGARVVYMQARHPDLFAFGLASSAPVGWKTSGWEYYLPVERSMAANNLTGCASDMHNIADYLSKAYKNKDITALKNVAESYHKAAQDDEFEQLGLTNGTSTLEDWADYISVWYGYPLATVQYTDIYSLVKGATNNSVGVKDFCDYFQSGVNGTATVTADSEKGYSASMDAKDVSFLYARAVGDVYSKAPASSIASGGGDSEFPFDTASWGYQVCTEVFSFQVGNSTRPTNIVPDFPTVQGNLDQCVQQYGSSAPATIEDAQKRLDKLHAQYGGNDIEIGNIVWTNGESDPWRFLGPTSDAKEDGGPFFTAAESIPACGKPLAKGSQLSHVVRGGVHCSDLSPFLDTTGILPPTFLDEATGLDLTLPKPIPDVLKAQKLWDTAIQDWLKNGCTPKANPVFGQ